MLPQTDFIDSLGERDRKRERETDHQIERKGELTGRTSSIREGGYIEEPEGKLGHWSPRVHTDRDTEGRGEGGRGGGGGGGRKCQLAARGRFLICAMLAEKTDTVSSLRDAAVGPRLLVLGPRF